MTGKHCLTILVWALVGFIASSSEGTGPREPLTFANTGVYCGFDEYLISKESPFDFVIVPASVIDGKINAGGKSWNEYLKSARANGKRVVADVQPILTDESGKMHSFAELYNVEKPLPMERFLEMFDRFFAEVDEEELYAVTIAEENVFWNGQQERMEQVYDYLKKKYDVPIYQWYSPSETAATPGLVFPNVRADGWAVDEYFIQKPVVERAMRMYTIMQKPAFQIVWAAPDMPSVPWSERTFWDQFETCRKYNIPIAFFCWTGTNETPTSNSWGWYPNASERMRETFENYCVEAARLAKQLPPVSQADWDLMPAGQKQVNLKLDESEQNSATYKDSFDQRRDFALWLDTSMTGFAHLKWDTSPLQLKPRAAGDAKSTVRYCFKAPGKPNRIVARIQGSTAGGGTVGLTLATMSGQVLAESAMQGDQAEIDFDASQYTDTRFVLTVKLAGHASEAGQVLAEFAGISVEAKLAGN